MTNCPMKYPVNAFKSYSLACETQYTGTRQARSRSREAQDEDEANQINKNPKTHDGTREAMDQRGDTTEWSELRESPIHEKQPSLAEDRQPKMLQELTKSSDNRYAQIYDKTFISSTEYLQVAQPSLK